VKVGRPTLSALLRSSFLSSIPNLLLNADITLYWMKNTKYQEFEIAGMWEKEHNPQRRKD
jgi:hypothetical protein